MLSYAAAVDDRDLARYRACFAEDAEIVGFGEETVTGADAWTASVESQLGLFPPPAPHEPPTCLNHRRWRQHAPMFKRCMC